ncbi:hypothetical protein GCM10023210_15980 [Chryseobacterium ginsengisoli]|uniref:Uncharacterized protein n=1 Tax=Chryseobacterium ginsengisoli TaxID=363853 RepID=A0ABP9M6G3_9FLAO
MINLQLLDVIKESLPNFDGENSSDLIKAEKILKAHQKIDPEFSLNDIENLMSFFKENGNKFNVLFQDENLLKIFKNEDFKINSSHNRIFPNIMQITPEFRTFCEEHIKRYIQVNIKNNSWENLRIFYKNYFPVISPLTKEFLIDQITQKNKLVRSVIPEPNHYNYLLAQYKHGINPHFYALQSDIDSSYFHNEILDINNDVSEHQNIDIFFRVFLGKILVALGHFDANTEELRRILKKNSRIGADWASKENTFDSRAMAQRFLQQATINSRFLESKKNEATTSEWITTIGYYAIIFMIFAVLLSVNKYAFLIAIAVEIIVFFIINNRMNRRYETLFREIDHLYLGKLKKFGHKLIQLQLYTLVIGVFIAIFVGTVLLCITKPILGIPLTFMLAFILRKEFQKYR